MKNYEITYLISSKLKKEEIETTAQRIESLFKENEISLIENKIEKKVLFPKEIKKEKEGFLANAEFESTPEKIKLLKKEMSKMPEILRFQILVKQPQKLLKKERFRIAEKVEKERIIQKEQKIKREKKVELGEIDKKLKEILGE
ncbi:MAG: hypothetical protein AMJ89_00030 [candidate division Zixibacteria bacterium SM23_73]|nr:MAG: hypothetical protein AMJ89_00030 [candidate division Zixibacteria bacterium SM23_73]